MAGFEVITEAFGPLGRLPLCSRLEALAAEFASHNVKFSEPLKDTHDGLRGFELKDADGYVLFFGRPR
jgi:hypothetical protein